ncbi:putative transporter YeaB [Paenibacillus sp. J31TS4]|uniref:cation diffusion facilitator family transporter n=1 Tax=Paenibacillus sp. J31TS4 TaxID=2807195 RepID=UPI001B0F29CD|nr:cation diffusion facilitator family transporter [Paenibacillus sp. J31TS4]GIP38469.1 putative transporter YeaB [Paenibacillus sp. J31TS4]
MASLTERETGDKGAWVSIIAYLCLSAIKLAIGLHFASEALVADGLNNTTDIAASIAILIGLRVSRRPPDHDHRYGHTRAETIASLVASLIMAGVGVQVVAQAVRSLFSPLETAPAMVTAWTALFCGLAMLGVYAYNKRLAARLHSHALQAAAQDNKSDALVSFGAFVGIVGAQFGLFWLDPLTAVLVGVIICKTAWDIFREATHSLTDGFEEDELLVLKRTVAATPGVEAVKDIKARSHGSQILVDVTIEVEGQLNVLESHEICDEVEQRMLEEHQIRHVHVHIEPQRPQE